MKHILITAFAFFSLSVVAQTPTRDTTKKAPVLTLQGDLQSFQVLLNALEQSSAPYKDVKALEAWIIGQLQKQVPQNSAPKK